MGAPAGEGSSSLRDHPSLHIAHLHYDDNIDMEVISLSFAPGYEPSELDEIEAAVTPLAKP